MPKDAKIWGLAFKWRKTLGLLEFVEKKSKLCPLFLATSPICTHFVINILFILVKNQQFSLLCIRISLWYQMDQSVWLKIQNQVLCPYNPSLTHIYIFLRWDRNETLLHYKVFVPMELYISLSAKKWKKCKMGVYCTISCVENMKYEKETMESIIIL